MRTLADVEWLNTPSIRRVFEAIEVGGDTARVVGGAVRNTLLGEPVADVDIATTATPDLVIQRAKAAGIKAVPTGIDHGTVTLVSSGIPFELTTLREDIETFGRHASVKFGRDWTADAERRDFTMNALYVDSSGQIHDPTGSGYADCLARHVRFIGDPDARIREDYLRILRLFRFHAQYGVGTMDQAGLSAVLKGRDGLRQLSAERVGHEIRRILPARGASVVVEAMADTGIIEIAVGGVVRVEDFQHLAKLADIAPEASDPALCLTVLACFIDEDVARLDEHLRLSNAEKIRIRRALKANGGLRPGLSPGVAGHELRERLYRLGRETAIDGVLVAWSRDVAGPDAQDWRDLLATLRETDVPVFPIKGRDLVSLGIPKGPKIGEITRALEVRWIASDFTENRESLLAVAKG